jgi:hypothetical protein
MKPKRLLILLLVIAAVAGGGYWFRVWREESVPRTMAVLFVEPPERRWATVGMDQFRPFALDPKLEPVWQRMILTHAEKLREGGPRLLAEVLKDGNADLLKTPLAQQFGGNTAAMAAWVRRSLRVQTSEGLAMIYVSLPCPSPSMHDEVLVLREIVQRYVRDELNAQVEVRRRLSERLSKARSEDRDAEATTSMRLSAELSKVGDGGGLDPEERRKLETLRDEAREARRRVRKTSERLDRLQRLDEQGHMADVRIHSFPDVPRSD